MTISGDKDAIEELEKVCKSPELFIERERGHFVLKSKGFNELSNDEEIYKQACETVACLNGAIKLALGYKGNLNVEDVVRVSDSGQWNVYGILSGESSSGGKLIVEMTKADGTTISEAAPVPHLVREAMNNERVAKVLKQIAENNLDWNKLNILFEEVQGDVGSKIIDNQWATKNDIDRFTQTAQPYRHGESGLKSWKPHNNPMLFEEAKIFVVRVVENWIKSKISENASTLENYRDCF